MNGPATLTPGSRTTGRSCKVRSNRRAPLHPACPIRYPIGVTTTPLPHQSTFDRLCAHWREVALLHSTQALLEWDERTKMPPAGGDYRAEQVSHLAGLVHRLQTEPSVGEYLSELLESPLGADRHSDTGAVIHNIKRDYDQKTKLPQALVEELARTSVLGQQVWAEARKANDFARFQPLLEKTIELKKQEAAALGYEDVPYDALLDEFEPGRRRPRCGRCSPGLREQLVPLVAAIVESGRRPNLAVLHRHCPTASQEKFGQQVAAAIGFDFQAGRLDVTHHPFCSTSGPRDVRLTTRYYEDFFPSALFSTMHEAGHGIYEQGLRADQFGLPTGEAVSLGIHESQSRMWENLVGRSHAFWEHFFPKAQQAFPGTLGDVPLDGLLFRHQRRAALADSRRGRRGDLQPAHHDSLRAGAGADLGRTPRRRSAGGLERKVRAVSRHQIADRCRRRAAGRPLERRADRLLPHLFARQPLRGPALRTGRSKTWATSRRCSPRRVRAAARVAADEHARAGPPLCPGGAGPPRHGRRHLPCAADAVSARQIRPALRPVVVQQYQAVESLSVRAERRAYAA